MGMEQIGSLWPVVTAFVLYTGLLFGGFAWMLKACIKPIEKSFDKHEKNMKELLKAQITPIKELLDNHITDTNKKIDKLSDRFDRLYEILIKDKTK